MTQAGHTTGWDRKNPVPKRSFIFLFKLNFTRTDDHSDHPPEFPSYILEGHDHVLTIKLEVKCNEVTTSPRRPVGQVTILGYKEIISQSNEFL